MPGPQVIPEPGQHDGHMAQAGAERLQLIQRRRPVAAGANCVPVDPSFFAGYGFVADRIGRKAEFGRTGDERHGAHVPCHLAHRAHDLELELRQAVAERVERDALENHIGRAAISGRIAGSLLRLDQRIGALGRRTAIDTHIDLGQVQLLPVRPDAANASNLAFRHSIGRIAEIAVIGDFGATLAALTGGGFALFKACRPDQCAGNPRRAINEGKCATFFRCRHAAAIHPRAFDMTGGIEKRVINGITAHRTKPSANGGPHRPEYAANSSAHGLQNNCCHESDLWFRKKKNACHAPAPLRHQRRGQHAMALIGMDEAALARHDPHMLGRKARLPAKHQKITRLRRVLLTPHRCLQHGVALRNLRPVGRVDARIFRLHAVKRPPDATHHPQTIATHAKRGSAVPIRRSDPPVRLGKNPFGNHHGTRTPPS